MSDEQLDVEIDRAVREMMSVDAPGGFRARILSKLEERPRRFGWMTFAGLGSMAAAAAVVMLMARMPALPPIADPLLWRPAPIYPPPHPVVHTDPATLPSRKIPRADVREQQRVLAAVAIAEPESTVAALDEIDPLFVAPVTARSIEPTAIAIAPLPAIPEVHVKPLSPPDGRD